MARVPNGRVWPRSMDHGRVLRLPIGQILKGGRCCFGCFYLWNINIASDAPLACCTRYDIGIGPLNPTKSEKVRGS
jgi:hypothetical protein